MGERILIIGSKKCPACTSLKEKLDENKKDNITYVDIEDKKDAQIILEKMNVEWVPAIFIVEDEKLCLYNQITESIEKCGIKDFFEKELKKILG